ncbi:Rho GTPase-activating protein 9 [Homalodisca vitripennis]|nr:Rho GTPase-activating protein 9 [Homalodisca vitripennis]
MAARMRLAQIDYSLRIMRCQCRRYLARKGYGFVDRSRAGNWTNEVIVCDLYGWYRHLSRAQFALCDSNKVKMKSLNLDQNTFDSVDTILWRNNPFYCCPLYKFNTSNVFFKNLCDNALSYLVEMCVQIGLAAKLAKQTPGEEDKGVLLCTHFEMASEESGVDQLTDDNMDKFEVIVKTPKEILSVSSVGTVALKDSRDTSSRCGCACHQDDFVLWKEDGQLYFKVFHDHEEVKNDKNSLNKKFEFSDLYNNMEYLLLEMDADSCEQNQTDLESFNAEFHSLFKEFDSLQTNDLEKITICDETDLYSFKPYHNLGSDAVLIPICGCKKNHVSNHETLGPKGSESGKSGNIDFLLQNRSKSENRKQQIILNENFNIKFDWMKPDYKQKNTVKMNLKSLSDGDPAEVELLPASVDGKGDDSDSGKDWKPSTLSVVLEEEAEGILEYWRSKKRTVSESSDVVAWKQDLWHSALYDSEDNLFHTSSETADQWFSSTDSEGRVYFFEENSNKSSWTLPESQNDNSDVNVSHEDENSSLSNTAAIEKSLNRNVKSKSMILSTRYEEPPSLTSSTHNWPQLWEGTMCVLKEGPLNKTKITENGKRVRKNWTSTHAVLTELLLLFFKDNKGFPSMMSGNGRPELSVDLNGAVVDTGDKVSSRKNVYMLSTVLGLQVLIQCDCAASAEQWLAAIQGAIDNLPSSTEAKGLRAKTESPSEDSKLGARINRSKSIKLKQRSASIEDLSINMAERQTKIKERLKKFFIRRPTVDLLVKKGIWKDEPVFGCLLEHACPTEPPRVPLFVQHCIRCIEHTEENMKTDGLYRASGNLSQVQKIRLQVDQNVYSLLEQEEDVHVLAGTLKLFFRELKQPLIPFKFFNKAIKASTNPNRSEKIKDFRDIVKSLPSCNHDTLKLLLQHLLRVTQYHEFNRMHIPNIAIVFGPTLMWPEQESLDMAFDLMQQNLVIECFLSDFQSIF